MVMHKLLFLVGWVVLCSPAISEDWPGWRGPRGDGSSIETEIPTRWDGASGENILWKTTIPGTGYSSPIVSKGSVFVTACDEDSGGRLLHRLDCASGEVLWTMQVMVSPLEGMHKLNSYASGTPVADGEHVFVTFFHTDATNQERGEPGEMVVACYDFDGQQKWLRRVGAFSSIHGYCTSVVLHNDLLIVNGDHDGESYLAALSQETGDVVWKTPREYRTRSYVTPLLRKVDGKMQAVLSGSKRVAAFDPVDGKRLWWVEGPTEQFVASMVFDEENFYLTAGFPTYHVMAIRPGGEGDVSESHVAWHVTDARCYVPSPVVVNGLLFIADDRGIGHCFDVQDGSHVWRERMGRHFSASLVTANELVYFTTDDGVTLVVQANRDAEVVQKNELGEQVFASPAISDGRIYLRGTESLYCIGKK
ncbi:MAG: PQQ-binding-like beta-propeller repeat protein [Pirellulaceae bacterium]|nr:PQQ-binding-like beta-propeller repeat protein [Pirellulaceae bacterium]